MEDGVRRYHKSFACISQRAVGFQERLLAFPGEMNQIVASLI
jgi:hypothetical protein